MSEKAWLVTFDGMPYIVVDQTGKLNQIDIIKRAFDLAAQIVVCQGCGGGSLPGGVHAEGDCETDDDWLSVKFKVQCIGIEIYNGVIDITKPVCSGYDRIDIDIKMPRD